VVVVGLNFISRRELTTWVAGIAFCIEPFFVPLEILASFFGFTGHTRVFVGGFVQNIN
jgi:hypothetical protein